MKCKEEDDDISVNSEHIDNEEKLVYEKLKIHCDKINVAVNASFRIKGRENSSSSYNINETYLNDNDISIISNQINSEQKTTTMNDRKPSVVYSIPDAISNISVLEPSTNYNSNILSSRVPSKFINKNISEEVDTNKIKYYSPQKMNYNSNGLVDTSNKLTKSHNKLNNAILNELYEENAQEEVKKAMMILNMKEKEINDMNNKYQSLKEKLSESKRKLSEYQENLEKVRNSNLYSKTLICGIIKSKHNLNK